MGWKRSSTSREFVRSWMAVSKQCYYCGVEMTMSVPSKCQRLPHNKATVDHKVPVSRGWDERDRLNWVVCCLGCNQAKGTRTLAELLPSN